MESRANARIKRNVSASYDGLTTTIHSQVSTPPKPMALNNKTIIMRKQIYGLLSLLQRTFGAYLFRHTQFLIWKITQRNRAYELPREKIYTWKFELRKSMLLSRSGQSFLGDTWKKYRSGCSCWSYSLLCVHIKWLLPPLYLTVSARVLYWKVKMEQSEIQYDASCLP